LDYLLSLDGYRPVRADQAMKAAGENGDENIINYLIEKGATDYYELLEGAIAVGNFNIFKKYFDQVRNDDEYIYEIFRSAVAHGQTDIAKFIVDQKVIDKQGLTDALDDDIIGNNPELIEYLVSKGGVLPVYSSEEESSDTNGSYDSNED